MQDPDLVDLFVVPLNRANITYMVTGSVASSIYGQPRLTNDIDLVVALTASDAVKIQQSFDTKDYYIPPIETVEAERRRPAYGHFNIVHHLSAFKADFFLVGSDTWTARALERRQKEVSVSGETIWIAPVEYVILNKLKYLRDGGSVKHISDISEMIQVQNADIDMEFLLDEIGNLGLYGEWERIKKITP